MLRTPAETPAPVPDALRRSTGFLLGKAAQLGAELVEDALQPLGLKARHYGVLVALQELGPSSQHALGQVLRIDRTTMVATIDHLEKLGYVHRTPHPSDRRSNQVKSTPAGTAVLKTVRKAVAAADEALVSRLSARQRSQLLDLLRQLCGLQ